MRLLSKNMQIIICTWAVLVLQAMSTALGKIITLLKGRHPKITPWSNKSVIVSLPLWRRIQLHCLWWWAQVPPQLCTPPPPFWVLLCERRWSPPVRSALPAAFPYQFCGCWVCKIASVVIHREESFNYNEMASFKVREQWEHWGFMQMY